VGARHHRPAPAGRGRDGGRPGRRDRAGRERLAAAGFTGIEVGLAPDPASFESADQLEAFLATVVLGAHLRDLPPSGRRPFVHAVVAGLDEPVVDYVRLQIRATRAADG